MSTPNRAAILTKTHKTLKKQYTAVSPPDERTVLETMLYACCLENAQYQQADDAFAKLQEMFYDWNEIRVTTVTELAEVMDGLPDPRAAATNLKRCLQTAFETHYSFDFEGLRKQNLGKAVKQLEKYGASPFVVAYVTQSALGGHSIPLDKGAMDTLVILGAVTEAEAAKHTAPGLERAITKSKGVEFGSLLHQLGADFHASPHSPKVRKIMTDIEPTAKDRLPKRSTKKKKSASKQGAATRKKKSAKSKSTAKKSASKSLSRKKPR